MPIATQSKFACLKVEDDTSSSEDEGKKIMGLGKGKQSAKKGQAQQKTAKKGNANGSLLVHVVPPKPKNKGKKSKKAQQVTDETGLIIQDADIDPAEMKYREELRQALKESYESSSQEAQARAEPTARTLKKEEPKNEEVREKSPAECLVLELDKEAKKIIAGVPKNAEPVIRLYRAKLLKSLEENSLLQERILKAEAGVDKYRNRYTKICEILKDVEINDKAKLVVQLEKAGQVETELGNQIGALQGELMQATSKVHELEAKIRELSTKR